MNKKIPVVYSKSGLANFYGSYIEINPKLKHNKPLRDFILKHELGHTDSFDLPHEFLEGIKLSNNPKLFFNLVYTYITTPSAWIDFSPVKIKNKMLVYDLNLSLLYLFSIGLVAALIYFSVY